MSTMPPPIIQYKNSAVTYGKTEALKGIDLGIPEGRVTVLIGPSGCGKSTTLRALNRLVPLSSGSIVYKDADVSSQPVTALRRSMGYAIQNVGLIPHLTVEQNISLVPTLLKWSKEKKHSRAEELLHLIGLPPEQYAQKFPSQLSGGEAQRVGVARALGADPPVLLLDEPFGAVDPLKREELQDEFVRIQRKLKKTVIFVTHDLDEAVRLADWLVIMKKGEIVQSGEPDQVLAAPANEFVSDFLGADRALKRLTLFTADRVMSPVKKTENGFVSGESGLQWKRESDGHITAAQKNGEPRRLEAAKHSVHPYSSLKECTSRILGLGLPAVPVIDDSGTISGEVLFDAIQKVSFEK